MSEEGRTLDEWIGGVLVRYADRQSRRSVLAGLGRLTLGMLGVRVAAVVSPLLIPTPTVAQASSWQQCGLRGHICGTGNCDCPSSVPAGNFCGFGSGIGSEWVSCCLDPSTMCYHCCYYKDKVTDIVLPPASGCTGPAPSGTQWDGHLDGLAYVCTVISCSGKISKDLANCKCRPVRTQPYCQQGPRPADS